MDVKSAFLNGYIDEEIYVEQPQGFIAKGSEEKVLRLKKALYGLKQTPRAWYSRIDKYFMDRGFRRSLSEPTLYIKSQGTDTLIVSLYVDDLIYIGNNEKMIQVFKEDMMKTFEMSDLGLMHFFLGIEINQEKEGIFICQRKYTETLLKKFKMESCKTVTTSFGYWRKVPERRWITKSRWLHVQKSHWKPTISNCHKTRYYVRYMYAIKVYAESEPSTLCSSKKDSKIFTRNERFWNMVQVHK
ncbi:UNVERIFIED_CONTAM: Retrovirus-related Pol polyprotein from transposon RE2 [Sesamum radiatum]|uniref:Retrovirus-related Pol polyprotein from transposon RE2 n=1 Tax=Sesamum radiatum TaxID=300843 RepID=A0AAW2WH23_SESRA